MAAGIAYVPEERQRQEGPSAQLADVRQEEQDEDRRAAVDARRRERGRLDAGADDEAREDAVGRRFVGNDGDISVGAVDV